MVTIVTDTIDDGNMVDFAGQEEAVAVNLRGQEEPMIRQVKFVSVPVRDQDRALAFYRDKLGFKVATDQPFDGNQRWIEMKIPGAETGVVLFTPKGQEDRVGTFFNGSLACDDVQKTYEELKGRGVEFDGAPKKEPWGTFVIFKDSEGNSLVLGSR
jgi:catechol 2,3-dioxygenase-like lactoylglutathione lyase family enzyme